MMLLLLLGLLLSNLPNISPPFDCCIQFWATLGFCITKLVNPHFPQGAFIIPSCYVKGTLSPCQQ
jgi:hypothetical protein